MPGHVELWGWDGAAPWVPVHVDAAGNLQVDVLAAPALVTHCYGWTGAAWTELLVESLASANLRTRLYDGVNPIVSVGTAADIADTNRGLLTQAGVRGWDGTFWKSVNVEDGAGDALVNARASLSTVSKLYGYNGATWDRLRVMTPADAFVTPTFALQVSSFLMGYDGVDWNMVRVDAAGHLQVDVLSSALPALAATAANQVLINANLATLVTEQGRCYGFDGTNWQTLIVQSSVYKNLKVALYDDADRINTGLLDTLAKAATLRAMLTVSALYVYDTTGSYSLNVWNAKSITDARAGTRFQAVSLMGFNGATWDRLRVMTPADAFATPTFALQVSSFLMGYNGTTWDMIRTEDATYHNLRVGIWQQDRIANVNVNTADGVHAGQAGLHTNARLYGYNGATFDRLRTYPTGILKVGRAEVGLLTARMTAAGQVGAAGARQLYWMALNPSAGNSLIELADAAAGGGAVVFDHFDTNRDGHMMTLDPPMEFSTGIYLETFTNMTSVIFGYL